MTELFHYGKYTLGTTSFSVLLGNVDTFMINIILGPAALAVYNLALRFMAIVELPIRTFLTTGMSEMAISLNKNDTQQVTYIFKKYTGMLTIALIPIVIGAILLADFPINFLGGAKYHGSIAANAFRMFIFISLLYPFDRFNGLALDVTRHTKINFYKMIIMLIATVVGDYTGLKIFGNIYGIALSDVIVIITAIAYGNYQLHKYMDYTIAGILSLGYSEIKLLVGKTLKLKNNRQ
jgi:O-antigen/teichoic acid export membrane protein